MEAITHVRVAIIGAGFTGIGMAIALRRSGIDDFVVFERAGDVGGTWRDNTYPGCQCDVPSHLYSYSFAPNPEWSRTYSPQQEIWDYLRGCARRFGVLPHVRMDHPVHRSTWEEEAGRWVVETGGGTWTADILILANGALSEPAIPPIPGRERFRGTTFHSASWNRNSDLRGRRVAVIGTGASAVQIVPKIQSHVEQLHLFQRTPAWVVPHSDRPITSLERATYRRLPEAQRLVRGVVYLSRELLVLGMVKDPRLVAPIRAAATAHLRRQVRDPVLRDKLRPRFSPGCKRLLPSNDFYPALARPNVEVVTGGALEIGETSVRGGDGSVRDVDTIVFATGFHVTDNPIAAAVVGRGGRTLAETWDAHGMRAYLGTAIGGFPNMFMLTGPNTGTGHTSVLVMAEATMRYVMDCLRFMDDRRVDAVEVKPEVVNAYNRDLQAKLRGSVWNAGGCVSWYLDRSGRNPVMWPDFTWRYRRITRRFDPARYHLTRESVVRIPPGRRPASV